MKILKRGTPPPQPPLPTYLGTCPKCGTEIEFTEREATWLPAVLNGDNLARCPCPTCQEYIVGTPILGPS